MSVIAWDGYTLAADRQCMGGGIARICSPKIGYLPNKEELLWAYTGIISEGEELLHWLETYDGDDDFFPEKIRNKEHCETILVTFDREGTVREYANSPFPVKYPNCLRYSGGSGADFAMTMLHLGRDSIEAVRIANVLSSECGGGIAFITFEDPEVKF